MRELTVSRDGKVDFVRHFLYGKKVPPTPRLSEVVLHNIGMLLILAGPANLDIISNRARISCECYGWLNSAARGLEEVALNKRSSRC